jgi:hypothetical protein
MGPEYGRADFFLDSVASGAMVNLAEDSPMSILGHYPQIMLSSNPSRYTNEIPFKGRMPQCDVSVQIGAVSA